MRFRRVLRVAAWNALLILAVLVIAEAAFGNWFFGPDLGKELVFAPADFDDYVHPLPAGSRRIGEFLAACLGGVV